MTHEFKLGLFSAQPENRERLEPQATARWPSNVPIVVDNLWEWYRCRHHATYPSRRYAIYALPRETPALFGSEPAEPMILAPAPAFE